MKQLPTPRPHIAAMTPYKPPIEGRSAEDFLRLDFNERTVPLPEVVIESLVNYVRENRLHVYPEYGDICAQIAAYAEVPAEQVIITNGSDQGIDVIFRTFVSDGDEVIIPAPTFAMQLHTAELQGAKIISPLYTYEKGFPLDEVLAAISQKTKLISICNPNSPTGSLLPVEGIEKIAAAAPEAVILVDECYFEFAQVSGKDSLSDYPNIVITRTFSKTWGFSALRLGYIIADSRLIEEFLKVRGPYDMNKPAVEVLRAALAHRSYTDEFVHEVMEVSKPMLEEYLTEKGIKFWPSQSNFVLLCPPDANALEASLRERLILTRPRKGPNIDNTLRINLGTREQTERLLGALEELL